MGDPETYWLNFTNIALGVVVLVCVLAVALGVVYDLICRGRARARADADLDRELRELVASYQGDPHMLDVRGLGITMADGGEERKPEDRG
jgi:hypothetical protein